ncbi:MAG: hypothetical protein QF463_08500 [Vicinamibacterales bacterium]|jgi:hypothetical protein|nr:hypothetical protein [Acidobacteriota bacterium]MDP6371621.1 hypothetical protein [Vicinamibacterales bacterium]MDP6609091.1 hypothetical protein [Vicinamibacterales bacterium]HAK56316.1 hypothetical protein [Acidobacteriota bacterium]|tara:strand:- start:4658 stop:5215 length:558 start_codon:yes stop_codon:yes gene_type:complete
MTDEHDPETTRSQIDGAVDEAVRRVVTDPAPATLRARVMARLAERRDRSAAASGGLSWSLRSAVATAVLVLAVATWGLLRAPGDQEDSIATQRAEAESGTAVATGADVAAPAPDAAAPLPVDIDPVASAPVTVAELAVPDAIVLDSIGGLEALEIPEIRIARNVALDMAPLTIETMTLTPLGGRH